MSVKSYIVAVNSLEGLFEQLDKYGFDYKSEETIVSPLPTYIVVKVWCYPYEIQELENIFAPYV